MKIPRLLTAAGVLVLTTQLGCEPQESTWYNDADGDGYGDANISGPAVKAPPGFVSNGNDCNDTDAAINPGATEIADNIDNDCDGDIDEDVGQPTTWYADDDSDGYGDDGDAQQSVSQPSGYIANGGDCDDTNAAINPGATESKNFLDDDCDGTVDNGFEENWYHDADADAYGDPTDSILATEFAKPADYIADNTDCDDGNVNVNPGATEVIGDGIDNDCNPATSDGTPVTWYLDSDGDNYGDDSNTTDAILQPSGYVGVGGDCDDARKADE